MTSRGKLWFQWTLIAIVSFQFIGAAIAKLSGQMCEHFMANGLSYDFMMFIGFAEAVSVVGLFIPSLRIKASLVHIGVMCGAIYSHIPFDQNLLILLNITNIGLSSIIIWLELDKKYLTDEMLLKGKEI